MTSPAHTDAIPVLFRVSSMVASIRPMTRIYEQLARLFQVTRNARYAWKARRPVLRTHWVVRYGYAHRRSASGHRRRARVQSATSLFSILNSFTDREIEIVQALQEKVLGYAQHIARACDICAELDCLLSFAAASRDQDYRRPRMTEQNVLDIKQGR